jgi:hypothetical protein
MKPLIYMAVEIIAQGSSVQLFQSITSILSTPIHYFYCEISTHNTNISLLLDMPNLSFRS